jgi:AcrR family transcriptional regulator
VANVSKKFIGDPSTRELILKCATAEIDAYGIIGLRLASVAEKARVSVPLIYKYFDDRDGLLAVVLGDWYEKFVFRYRTMVDTWIDAATTITLEEFAQLSPKPQAGAMQKDREFRLQVLATALENPQLRHRIKALTIDSHAWGNATMDRAIPKLPESDRHFDRRFFSLLLFNTMYVFYDLLDTERIDDEQYISFLVHLVRASSHENYNTSNN